MNKKIFTFQKNVIKKIIKFVLEYLQTVLWVKKGHHPASLMVWWSVSYDGIAKPHFYENYINYI